MGAQIRCQHIFGQLLHLYSPWWPSLAIITSNHGKFVIFTGGKCRNQVLEYIQWDALTKFKNTTTCFAHTHCAFGNSLGPVKASYLQTYLGIQSFFVTGMSDTKHRIFCQIWILVSPGNINELFSLSKVIFFPSRPPKNIVSMWVCLCSPRLF